MSGRRSAARRALVRLLETAFVCLVGAAFTVTLAAFVFFTAMNAVDDPCVDGSVLLAWEGMEAPKIEAERTLLPPGVRCVYGGEDGSVVATTLEPAGYAFGWALAVAAGAVAAGLIVAAPFVAARMKARGHGKLHAGIVGLLVLLLPPLGFLLAVTARDPRTGDRPRWLTPGGP